MQIYFPKHRCLDEYLSVPIILNRLLFFCCILFLINNARKHCWWISQTISYPFFPSCFISFSKTFSFLSSDLVFRASVKHWWCLTYKGNLCTSQLVPPCLSAFSCPCSPPQMSHQSVLMLVEDRQKMQGKCITLTAQSTGLIEGRSITSNSHVKKARCLLQLLPGWVLILQILHIFRRCVSSLSYVFHTSLNISKALALPLPHTITSSQMSCSWGSCASSSKKYSIPLPATGPLAFLNSYEAPSAKRNNVIYNIRWSETLHLRRCSGPFSITHGCQNQIC